MRLGPTLGMVTACMLIAGSTSVFADDMAPVAVKAVVEAPAANTQVASLATATPISDVKTSSDPLHSIRSGRCSRTASTTQPRLPRFRVACRWRSWVSGRPIGPGAADALNSCRRYAGARPGRPASASLPCRPFATAALNDKRIADVGTAVGIVLHPHDEASGPGSAVFRTSFRGGFSHAPFADGGSQS